MPWPTDRGRQEAPVDLGGKRLVVIGGAGFIGSHTVDTLLRDDIETWADRFLGVLGRPRGEVSDLERMAAVELH